MCALTQKLLEGVQGWHPYALTSADHRPKIVFGYLGWVCSKCIMPKVIGGFRGGAPYAYTSAHHRPKKKRFWTYLGWVHTKCAMPISHRLLYLLQMEERYTDAYN